MQALCVHVWKLSHSSHFFCCTWVLLPRFCCTWGILTCKEDVPVSQACQTRSNSITLTEQLALWNMVPIQFTHKQGIRIWLNWINLKPYKKWVSWTTGSYIGSLMNKLASLNFFSLSVYMEQHVILFWRLSKSIDLNGYDFLKRIYLHGALDKKAEEFASWINQHWRNGKKNFWNHRIRLFNTFSKQIIFENHTIRWKKLLPTSFAFSWVTSTRAKYLVHGVFFVYVGVAIQIRSCQNCWTAGIASLEERALNLLLLVLFGNILKRKIWTPPTFYKIIAPLQISHPRV